MSGNRFALAGALMGSTAIIGPMTAAERSKGRYMRAPDGHGDDAAGTGDAAFDEFNEGAKVEVGKPAIETNEAPPEKPAKPARSGKGPAEKGAVKPAEKAAADKAAGKTVAAEADEEGEGKPAGEGDGDEEEDDEEEEPEPERKPKKASERIRELTKRLGQRERMIDTLAQRLDAIEKGGLPTGDGGRNSRAAEKAPDPTDAEKYPLGHLDDRYIEDKLEWLAEQKATGQADAVLQRQQESEQTRQAQEAHNALLEKVDDLSTRGSELYDDFQESVVEGGLAGKWDLGQPTFEAAHEAVNGAQILYELSQDKKEATRVAKLSPTGQVKFVLERDAEITTKAKPRTKPGAGEPPLTRTRGANSSSRIDPATDDLGDFEKAWAADEKANG